MNALENQEKIETTAREILRKKGFRPVSEIPSPKGRNVICHWSRLEIWTGPKGVVIMQHWKDGSGVHCYADWPLGNTWEELDAALK